MIVVTGATGLVGNVLLRSLAAAGETELRAVVRPGPTRAVIADLEVELVEGNVDDYDSLVSAFQGAEVVYHVAGLVSISSGGYDKLHRTNVEGTRNVLAACREAQVRRLAYTSSVHAFPEPPRGTCLNEDTAIDPSRSRGAYDRSKAEATLLVLQAAREGLDAVIVYPSGIIGPYDFRPSHTGETIRAAAQGRLGAYVRGAYNFVDVRDVVQGLIAAAHTGRPGEGYLLTGHEITVSELLGSVEIASGTPAPRLRLPLGFTRAVSFVIPAYYWLARQRPLFTTYSLGVIASNCSMTYEKAARELGYHPRPFQETIDDTVRWFEQQGML